MTIARSIAAPSCAPAAARKASLATRLKHWAALSRQRRTLSKLDAHQLADIGLTHAEAVDEAERAPWDVPAHWRAGC